MSNWLAKPRDQRYFEDYVVGTSREFGSIKLSAEEIIEYAKRYDPQPMHTDPVAAKNTPFGELIASGWHTASVMMRLFVDNYLSSVASLASPGVDEVRWQKPVRPNDTLSARITVIEARRSASKPDRGIVRSYIEVTNQHGEVVMKTKAMNLFMCRDAGQ
jgi:acyl dehydratase